MDLKRQGGPTRSKAMTAAANVLSMESNFPYVRGIGPLGAGTTKAEPDRGVGTIKIESMLKSCVRTEGVLVDAR